MKAIDVTSRINGPHQGQPVVAAGATLDEAKAVMITVHGRGATAESILQLSSEFYHPDMAYLAPQASGNTWYPHSFLAPMEKNEPGISSGLQALADVIEQTQAAGVPPEKTILMGFSQGACLTVEFLTRHPKKYGGGLIFTGGLIGPDVDPSRYTGSLDHTPIFLGSSDIDPHVPLDRVNDTETILTQLGATVDKRIYPNMPHTINHDELSFAKQMVIKLTS